MADTWTGVIGRLGVPTGDGRVIMPAGFTTRELPLPLSWQRMSDDGHQRSVIVGRIDTITPDPATGNVTASGAWLDAALIPEVAEAQELVRNRVVGPSMDAGACEMEYQYTGGGEGYYAEDGYHDPEPMGEICVFTAYECAGATLVSVPAFTGVWVAMDGADSLTAAGVRSSGWSDMPVAGADVEWDGDGAAEHVASWAGVDSDDATEADWEKYARAFLWQDPDADPQTRGAYKLGVADVVDGELTLIPRGVYAVAGVLSGARGGADIPEEQQDKLKGVVRGMYEKIATALDDDTIEAPFAAVVASAAPTLPPMDWYTDPKLDGPTPVTITDDGRVFGHAALWGTCHIGLPGCVTPPNSPSGYAYFRTGATLTDGGEVPTGKLTVGGGHADGQLGYAATAEHYDNVCASVATVAAGEDQFGIWVAGSLLPGATEGQVEALRQSPLSGDWRDIGGSLELVAAHAVNVPGFPVPRPRAVVASSGRQLSLVAAGVVAREESQPAQHDDAYVARLAAALKAELNWTRSSQPTAFAFVSTPEGFDPAAEDLRAEFTRHGLSWPTLVGEMNGVPVAPFEIAEGCVRGWLAANAPVELAIEPVPAPDNGDALRRAQAKLAALRLDRVKGR